LTNPFDEHFKIKDSADSLLNVSNNKSLCVIENNVSKLLMKVNPIKIDDQLLLYVGYPILTGGMSLKHYGLTIMDLPQHDAVVEFLFIMEGMKRSMVESDQYLNEIMTINNNLDALVKSRTQQLEEKNEELEGFVRMVSHDLRSPVRVINSFTDILLTDFQNMSTEASEMLGFIKKYAQSMSIMIDDLLRLSRINQIELHEVLVDIRMLLLEVIEELKSQGENHLINYKINLHDLHSVNGDTGLLKLVLNNLLANAIKYSSKSENPTIDIGMMPSDSNEMVFYIKDNGVGFDSDKADGLFKPFYRMHDQSEFEGTGIGLSIVNAIIKKHHGRVWAKSKRNEGATFFIALPFLTKS
jgi:signal transduction histidine kinase